MKKFDAGRRLAEACCEGNSPTQRNGTIDAHYNRWKTSVGFLGASVRTSIKCALASFRGSKIPFPPVGSNHPDLCEHSNCTPMQNKTIRARGGGVGSSPWSVLCSVQAIRTNGVDGFCPQQVLKIA